MKRVSDYIGDRDYLEGLDYMPMGHILEKDVIVHKVGDIPTKFGKALVVVIEIDGKKYFTIASSEAIRDKLMELQDKFPLIATFYERHSKTTDSVYYDVK